MQQQGPASECHLMGFFFAFWGSMPSFFTRSPQCPLPIFAGWLFLLAALFFIVFRLLHWNFLPSNLLDFMILISWCFFCIFLLQYSAKAGPQFVTLMHCKMVLFYVHFFDFLLDCHPFFPFHLSYIFSFSLGRESMPATSFFTGMSMSWPPLPLLQWFFASLQ